MGSYDIGKPEAIEWIHQHFREGETCLDVGACNGKWSRLLKGFLKIDAVEAFAPNIFKNHLQTRYNRVYKADIRELEYEPYDLIIFGDVLEHMSVEEAQKVLEYAWPRCRDLIVAVPYMHDQGEKYGNPYEVHIQNDLTHERVLERYPRLVPLFITDNYGYYTKGEKMLQKDRSIEEVNAVIRYMKDLCKSCNTCIECPMNHNCNEQPAHWEEVTE